jgi:hypothetical protein
MKDAVLIRLLMNIQTSKLYSRILLRPVRTRPSVPYATHDGTGLAHSSSRAPLPCYPLPKLLILNFLWAR